MIDNALIIAATSVDLCLCVVFLLKQRVRQYPAVFLLILLDLASSPFFYFVSHFAGRQVYNHVYLSFGIISFCLQLWVLFEVAKQVLRPTGIWTRKALKPLALFGFAGALVAALAVLLLQPMGSALPGLAGLRADVFTGLLTSELVIAMMLSAGGTGLGWRNHVMAIGQGLMFWSLVGSTADGLSAYLDAQSSYLNLIYLVRVIAYLGVVSYWCVSLWHEEPARKPISPALRKYVLALHGQVHYDLGKVGH